MSGFTFSSLYLYTMNICHFVMFKFQACIVGLTVYDMILFQKVNQELQEMKLQLVTEQEKADRLESKLEQVEVSLLCCLGKDMNI